MKILYVEDNEDNVYLLRRRLAREPITLLTAASGNEGIRLAMSERPDLILMDLDLPDIDGFEATRQLRSSAATRAIPIIALSAGATEQDSRRALEAGCNDYDTKPLDLGRLRAKIDALLRRA
jgi:two-component system, cell cycle response regulator DivK